MISLRRLNNSEFFLNPNLIETLEATPDTVIKLKTEKMLIVKDSISEIIDRIIQFNRKIYLEKSRTE